MQPVYSLFSIILLVGAAHGLFLTLTLINIRDGRGSGRLFLALLTFVFAIDLGHEFLYQSHYLLNVPILGYIDPVLNLLYGPSFYLYVRALTKGAVFNFSRKQWLHILPFIFAVLICLGLPELNAEQFEHFLYNDGEVTSNNESLIKLIVSRIAMASVISIGCYLYFSIRIIIIHTRLVRQQFSSIEKVTLNWLRNLLIALSVLYSFLLFDGFFSDLIDDHNNLNNLLYLMIVAVIYTMGYMGMRQPAIFTNRESVSDLQLVEPLTESTETLIKIPNISDEIKYKTSALDFDMSSVLKEELQKHMKIERPFLNSQLTLHELAKQLSISPNYLSQVINEQLQMNFFDFINEYRVVEAKSILSQESLKKTSIISTAYDSGFNSKSAFYAAFKKHVGTTPTEYKKTTVVERPL